MLAFPIPQLPTDESFISRTTPSLVQRLRKNGWSDERTLFLEIPFAVLGGNGPMGVGLGTARDYRRAAFYICFTSSTGALQRLSDRELQVVVAHEMDEVSETKRETLKDALVSPMRAPGAEEARHRLLMQNLETRFGKALVHDSLQSTSRHAESLASVESTIFLFWLNYYVSTHPEELLNNAQEMSPQMNGPRQRQNFFDLVMHGLGQFPQGQKTPRVTHAVDLLLEPWHGSKK